MALDNTVLIEATGSCVQKIDFLRFYFSDSSRIKCLRPMFFDSEEEERVLSKVKEVALDTQGLEYDLRSALRSVFPRKGSNDADKFFCSQLVASVCRLAGFPLFELTDSKVTPNHFLECGILRDVSEDVIERFQLINVNRHDPGTIYPLDTVGDSNSDLQSRVRAFVNSANVILQNAGYSTVRNFHDVIHRILDICDDDALDIAKKVDLQLAEAWDSLDVIKPMRDSMHANGPENMALKVLRAAEQTNGESLKTDIAVIERNLSSIAGKIEAANTEFEWNKGNTNAASLSILESATKVL